MPLDYEVDQELDLSALTYNGDDIATLVVAGGRYSGDWALNALPFAAGAPVDGPFTNPIGSISTYGRQGNPHMAFDTALAWVNDACAKAGLRLAHAEDRNHERPEEEQPYFATGLFLIDRR